VRQGRWDDVLYDVAESQSGCFSAAQAFSAGLHQVRLVQLEGSKDIDRVSRGVYRLMRYPASAFGQYMEAVLWPQVRRPKVRGVISHESALAMYGLSDVSPSNVLIRLPAERAIRNVHASHLGVRLLARQIVDGQAITHFGY